MKLKLKKLPLFRMTGLTRSILSYLVVFLFPFLIVSGIWFKTSKDSINQQVTLSARNHLLQLQSAFENNLMQLNDLSHQIPFDNKLSLAQTNHAYYATEGQQSLKKSRLAGSIVADVFLLYYDKPDALFSADGWLSLDVFLKEAKAESFAKNQVAELFQTKVPKLVNLASKTAISKRLYYLVPLQNQDQVAYGTAIYAIKDSSIQQLLDQSTFGEESSNFIVNKQNEVLFHTGKKELLTYLKEKEQLQQVTKKTHVKIEQQDYQIQALDKSSFDLAYISLVDPNNALDSVNQVQRNLLYFIGFILIIGAIVVYVLGRRSYQPMRQLEKLIANYTTQEVKEGEYAPSFVHERIEQFLDENKALHQEIKRQTPHAREQVLRKLIGDRIKTQAQLQLLLDSVHVKLTGQHFFVMTISTKENSLNEFSTEHDLLIEYLQTVKGKGYTAYATEILSTQVIAILVGYEEITGAKRIAEAFHHEIFDLVGLQLTIAIGDPVDNLIEINRSFIEALAALEYAYSQKSQKIIFYDALKDETKKAGIHYPDSEEMKLVQSLTQGDYAVATETIHALIEVGVKQGSPNAQKMFGFYLLNTLTKFASKIDSHDALMAAEKATDFHSLYDLEPNLLQIAQLLCALVQEKPQNKESQLKQELFDFINKNYAASQLSLEWLAEEFDMSVSYLSRFIKKESGLTFSKYIQELRLNKIKQALVETNRPIKDIIRDAGYYDVSNYTRKFRTIVGVTPGQYRTLHQN